MGSWLSKQDLLNKSMKWILEPSLKNQSFWYFIIITLHFRFIFWEKLTCYDIELFYLGVQYIQYFLYQNKIDNTKFTTLQFFSVKLIGIKVHSHCCTTPPPSISRMFSSSQTETWCMLSSNSPSPPSLAPGSHHYSLFFNVL